MSSPNAALKVSPAGSARIEEQRKAVEFESHYGLSCSSVREALQEVLEDMLTHKTVHNWDQKLIITPLKLLSMVVRRYIWDNASLDMNNLLASTAVEHVLTVDGMNHRYPAMQQPGNLDQYLFFRKQFSEEANQLLKPRDGARVELRNAAQDEQDCNLINTMHGRIVHIEEQIRYVERAALLILFTLYSRLQNEDYAFINTFLERHLGLRNSFKMPGHWQQMSSPQLNSDQQKFYRRVTMSCHVVYMTMNVNDTREVDKNKADRTLLFPLRSHVAGKAPTLLFRACASVLLTIVVPEESTTREEEIKLLYAPEGLWTVMVVNCPLRLASHLKEEPPEYLTPIAQYLRGIASSIHTQRVSAEAIYEDLRKGLDDHEDGSLFDDENFSKSNLYHWTVKTCEELRESVSSSQRFLNRMLNKQISQLCKTAHCSEKTGVEYWKMQLEEEVYVLEELQSQIVALNTQVQESRNALHGVTAVLEARVALQQGERTKTLAYLATLYLPLTASASIYSMAVLPKSTTLWSFFIVLALFFAGTVCAGLYSTPLRATMVTMGTATSELLQHAYDHLQSNTYLRKYAILLNPSRASSESFTREWPSETPEWILLPCGLALFTIPTWMAVRRLPVQLVHRVFVRELLFPRDKYVMFLYLENPWLNLRWHPLIFVVDAIRLLLLPVWVALIVFIVVVLVVQDAVVALSSALLGMLRWLLAVIVEHRRA